MRNTTESISALDAFKPKQSCSRHLKQRLIPSGCGIVEARKANVVTLWLSITDGDRCTMQYDDSGRPLPTRVNESYPGRDLD